MKTRSISLPLSAVLLLPILLLLLPSGAAAVDDPDPVIVREAAVLDEEIAALYTARDAEQVALDAYRAASEQFFAEAGASGATPEQIRALAKAMASRREDAVQRMRKTQDQLLEVFEQAERVRDLYDRQNSRSDEPLPVEDTMDGAWSFSIEQFGDFGVVELDQDGGMVRGQFRLKNGNTGTLDGSFEGDYLRLQSFRSGQELTGQFEGTLTQDGDLVDGTYNLTVLNAPVPVQGTWRLRRVSRPPQ